MCFLVLVFNGYSAITVISYSSKFEKDEPTKSFSSGVYSGFPAHNYSVKQYLGARPEDVFEEYDESKYYDLKAIYYEEREKSDGLSKVYNFDTDYKYEVVRKSSVNDYERYKRDFYETKHYRIGYFKSNGVVFSSFESYERNDFR